MKKLNYLITILISIILLGCSETPDIQVFGNIKGTVMDKIKEEPLSGVSVSISPLGKSLTTDNNGEFEFLELEPQEYTISISKNQYNSEMKSIIVEPGITAQADFSIMTGNGAIELSKHSLDFGKEDNSLVFDIANIGKSELFYDIASAYDWLSITPNAGSINSTRIQPITVNIDRSKITENKNITLSISSNAGSDEIEINVEYNPAVPQMELSKSTLDFGKGINSVSFDIKNKGNADLEFSVKDTEEWISFSPNAYNIKPGGVGTVVATIDRTKIHNNIDTEFSVASNAGSQDIIVKVSYVEKLPEISINKTFLDFGDNYNILSFDIENTGDDDLEFSISESYDWISFSPSKKTIRQGEISSVTVSINRSMLSGSKTENFTIMSNAGSKSIKVSIIYVQKYPILSVSKTMLDYGLNSNSINFTISNTGDADLRYWITENEDWIKFSPSAIMSIEPHKSINVTATIDRDEIFSNINRTFEISSNANSANIGVQVECGFPEMTISNSYLDFGSSTDFESSMNFTIKNTGGAILDFTIDDNDQYVSFSPASKTLDPGQSTTIRVTIKRYNINALYSTFSKNFYIKSNAGNSSIIVKVKPINPFSI